MARIYFLVILFVLVFSGSVFCQVTSLIPTSGKVAADSGEVYINVENLRIDFVFAGYGTYIPSQYPILTELPLENGERVKFDKIKEVFFTGKRVFWKKFIDPKDRTSYKDIDENGYRHWSDIEIDVIIFDWDGNKLVSRIERPELADVYLRGNTERGSFQLQLDQENNKKVHLIFNPNFIMVCPKDTTHVFPNSDFKFCPYCAKTLTRQSKDKVIKAE